MNIEDLPYPMFATTKEEKEILLEAKKLLGRHSKYLCDCIHEYTQRKTLSLVPRSEIALILKIGLSIKGRFCLFSYFCSLGLGTPSMVHSIEIRKIWIDKLLAYTGE